MDRGTRLKRLHFRAWHRGTREADYLMGGFFDRYHRGWGEAEIGWFEALVDEEDVNVLDWVLGAAAVPERYQGELITAMQRLDFVEIIR